MVHFLGAVLTQADPNDMSPLPNDASQLAHYLANALSGLRYGAIEITVHDGRVVQIERREKLRAEAPRDAGAGQASARFEPRRR